MKSRVPQKSNQSMVIALIFLVLLSFLLGIGMMINVNEKNRVAALLDERTAEIGDIKEELRDSKMDVEQLRQKYMQAETRARAAGPAVTHLSEGTAQPMSADRAQGRIAYLEKELNAAEQQAALYFSKLTDDQKKRLASDGDATIKNIVLSRERDSDKTTTVEFDVVNNTPREMAAVLGVIRFWQNSRIVMEDPFRVSNIQPNNVKGFRITLPIEHYDRYNVMITGLAGGASKAPPR